MKIKVCGMKYADNIAAVAELQPDFMGFIFYEKSARYIENDIPELPTTIQKVGVFVNALLDEVVQTYQQHQLQLVQLHGQESPEFCTILQEQNIPVIKAFSVDAHFNFEELTPYENSCTYFLFDTKGENPGGNGKTFNWDILENYPSSKPFFLSGGIQLEHANLLKNTKLPLFAIDINSKFETAPALKNTNTLHTFFNLIKS